jgi:hypothetical protein
MRPSAFAEGGIRSKTVKNTEKRVSAFEEKVIVAVCEGKTPDSVTGMVFAVLLMCIIKLLLSVSA